MFFKLEWLTVKVSWYGLFRAFSIFFCAMYNRVTTYLEKYRHFSHRYYSIILNNNRLQRIKFSFLLKQILSCMSEPFEKRQIIPCSQSVTQPAECTDQSQRANFHLTRSLISSLPYVVFTEWGGFLNWLANFPVQLAYKRFWSKLLQHYLNP